MARPLTITLRRIEGRQALEAAIRERFEALGRYCPVIISGRVLVETAERHHRDGNRYHVRVSLNLPGEDVVIEHQASVRPAARAHAVAKTRKRDELDRSHRYAGVAVREAFEAARRRLQDRTRRVRGQVKVHTPLPEGRVVRLFPSRAYGFLEADDGHEVYFQKASVLEDAFGDLEIGTRVVFVEERGDKGPQASTVRVVG